MSKMKDALILTVITLIAGALLGGVYELTKEPIAQQEIAANAAAYQAVFPEASEFKMDDALTEKVSHAGSILESSEADLGNVVIEDALYAYDASGSFCGLVVKSTSGDGYGGDIRLVAGIRENADGTVTVTGINFLEINETAGLGMRATEPEFKEQFQNKTVESFELVKEGASSDNQIDALSGASYTSNAVTNAVNAALCFARESALRQ